MNRIVMQGPRKSKVVDVDIPRPNDHQLLVKVTYTGMCHSEWYPWSTAFEGQLFGHEPVGVVAEVGKAVTKFKVGDRVTGLGAGYAEYVLMSESRTVHVPDNLSDVDAIAEPLSCMMSAVSRMPLTLPGEEDLARSTEDNHIFELGFQNVMEFAGTPSALALAGEMVRAHGMLCIGGYHNDGPRSVDFTLWNVKAMTVQNAHERRSGFQTECCRNALDLLSSGKWDFKGVTNHIYTMEEFDRANEEMESKPKGYIKAAIRCAD